MQCGQEFYGDDAEPDLIPTSQFQARIQNESSTVVSINCNYSVSTCTGEFKADHLGMWHTTSQTMGWKIKDVDTGNEDGVSVIKTGGTGCATWLTLGPVIKVFCTDHKQNNTHTGTYTGQPCTARASLTTQHEAAYLLTAGVSIGVGPASITPGSFGANSKQSIAVPKDWHDTGCDEDCSTNGGGAVTSLRPPAHGGPWIPEEEETESPILTCGTESGSPGSGGGGPPSGDSQNCLWTRYFVIYDDGSWDWMGGWQYECDGDPMRLPVVKPTTGDSTAHVMSGSSTTHDQMRARVFGMGPLKSQLAVEVHRYRGDGVHALVYVDTLRATAADLDAALAAVEGITAIRSHDHVAGIVRRSPSTAAARSGPSAQALEFLQSLRRAPEKEAHGQSARSIDVTFPRGGWRMLGG